MPLGVRRGAAAFGAVGVLLAVVLRLFLGVVLEVADRLGELDLIDRRVAFVAAGLSGAGMGTGLERRTLDLLPLGRWCTGD